MHLHNEISAKFIFKPVVVLRHWRTVLAEQGLSVGHPTQFPHTAHWIWRHIQHFLTRVKHRDIPWSGLQVNSTDLLVWG